MNKKTFTTIVLLVVLAATVAPVSSWVVPPTGNPNGEDNKWEAYGPHVKGIVVKIFANEGDMLTTMDNGGLDIEGSALNATWVTKWKNDSNFTLADYGGNPDIFEIDINNNATYGPGPGSYVHNPTSELPLREALALCANRSDAVALSNGTVLPVWTVVPSYMAGYIDTNVTPGGLGGDPGAANAILDTHFFPIDSNTGFRFWDIDHDGDTIQDGNDQPLNLIFYSRSGLRGDFGDDYNALLNNTLHIKTTYYSHVPRSRVIGPVYAQAYFNLYTGGLSDIGPDANNLAWEDSPDAIFNDPLLLKYVDWILYNTTFAGGLEATMLAQERYAEIAAGIPLWCSSGIKAYKNDPVEDQNGNSNWIHLVNQKDASYPGVDGWWSTLDMMQEFTSPLPPPIFTTANYYPDNFTYYGLPSTIAMLNPVYAINTWDWEVLNRIYDSGARRDPMTEATWVPSLFKNWTEGIWVDPMTHENLTRVHVTLRPDCYWQDGQPVTIADMRYTLVEISRDLMAKGLPPPSWYSNVQPIRDFEVFDAYNFEILLNVSSVWAINQILGNIIIPKHIWKPIVDASSPLNDLIQSFQPDPDMIGSGPFIWQSGDGQTPGSSITLIANAPGTSVVHLPPGHSYVSPGFWNYCPIHVNVHADNYYVKINTGEKLGGPIIPSVQVNLTLTIQNLLAFNATQSPVLDPLDVIKYIYINGVLIPPLPPYPSIPPEGQDIESLNISLLRKTLNYVKVAVHIIGPPNIDPTTPNPFLDQWINVTLPIWVTIKEDIAGSTLYDDLGYSSYPIWLKNEAVTPDLKVDGKDIALAAKAFGTVPGDSRWSAISDVNKDYKVDGKDIALIAKQFGW